MGIKTHRISVAIVGTLCVGVASIGLAGAGPANAATVGVGNRAGHKSLPTPMQLKIAGTWVIDNTYVCDPLPRVHCQAWESSSPEQTATLGTSRAKSAKAVRKLLARHIQLFTSSDQVTDSAIKHTKHGKFIHIEVDLHENRDGAIWNERLFLVQFKNRGAEIAHATTGPITLSEKRVWQVTEKMAKRA